jgi:bacteriorhodopsin
LLDDQASVGHPSDWLACALFASSSLLLIARWFQSADMGKFPLSAVIYMTLASALCVQIDPIGDASVFPLSTTMTFFDLELNVRLVLLALCCLGVGEALRARGPGYRVAATLMALAGVIITLAAGYTPQDALRWGYFASTLAGVAALAALAPAFEIQATHAAGVPARAR